MKMINQQVLLVRSEYRTQQSLHIDYYQIVVLLLCLRECSWFKVCNYFFYFFDRLFAVKGVIFSNSKSRTPEPISG